jgi:hypothetical protein
MAGHEREELIVVDRLRHDRHTTELSPEHCQIDARSSHNHRRNPAQIFHPGLFDPERPSIHAPHREIEQDQRRSKTAPQQIDCHGTIIGFHDWKPFAAQEVRDGFPNEDLVVDDEDGPDNGLHLGSLRPSRTVGSQAPRSAFHAGGTPGPQATIAVRATGRRRAMFAATHSNPRPGSWK